MAASRSNQTSEAVNGVTSELAAMTVSSNLTQRDLFGGAMRCGIPSKWRDVSDVRQVPDHQEVYQDCVFVVSAADGSVQEAKEAPTGVAREYEGTGGLLIVEVLDRQEDVADNVAARYFFHDLADANGCPSGNEDGRKIDASQVVQVGVAVPTHPGGTADAKSSVASSTGDNLLPCLSVRVNACTCVGSQLVAMGRDKDVGGNPRQQEIKRVKVELCAVRLRDVNTDLLITLSMPVADVAESRSVGRGVDKPSIVGVAVGGGKKKGTNIVQHSRLFCDILSSFTIADWSLFG